MREALKTIVNAGARPVIIKSISPMPHGYMSCFYQHIKLRNKLSANSCSTNNFHGDEDQWFSQLFVKMKKEYPSLIMIDPKDVQCEGEFCMSDINGIPVYRDVGHLTDYASSVFGQKYLRTFGNPFI